MLSFGLGPGSPADLLIDSQTGAITGGTNYMAGTYSFTVIVYDDGVAQGSCPGIFTVADIVEEDPECLKEKKVTFIVDGIETEYILGAGESWSNSGCL